MTRKSLIRLGRPLPPVAASDDPALRGEDWQQANPRRIAQALEVASGLPSGGWFVLDASRAIGVAPRGFVVNGQELVAWRDETGSLCVAPDACPHMGARLSEGHVCRGALVCPWHGLALRAEGRGSWRPLTAHDDGVLAWVRLDEPGIVPSTAPFLPRRPARYIEAVMSMEARCDPQDVIANRLDPWHGAHFHPYAFAALEVLERSETLLKVRVAKRLVGRVAIEVDATFHCPDPRTIVMTIVAGEGEGSVVETHATPIEPGRCRVIEATLAASDRPGFQLARRLGASLVRPFMERAARQLWVDDVAYAERTYALRQRASAQSPLPSASSQAPLSVVRTGG